MQLIILAAGQGIRLGGLANNKPKCLVEVLPGIAYLELALKALQNFQINKKIIVGGYGIDVLTDFLATKNFDQWQVVNNADYHKANLYSLTVARGHIDEQFFMFNADHYYSGKTYQNILSQRPDVITVFCDRDRDLVADDMKVQSAAGRVVRIAKNLTEFDYGYVGVTCVPQAQLGLYWQACDEVAHRLGDKAYVEAVIAHLAANGVPINIADVSGSWWTEIDTPQDLENAKKTIGLAS